MEAAAVPAAFPAAVVAGPDDPTKSEPCPQYISPEGCKQEGCPLRHPVAPNGNVTTRVCDYYTSGRGCAKESRCDFLHEYGKPKVTPQKPENLCSYYLSERGCSKEDRCDFHHPKAPDGTVTKRLCEYFSTTRGCAKDERCDFLHIQKEWLPAPAYAPPPAYAAAYPAYPGFPPAAHAPPAGGDVPGHRPARPTKAQADGNSRVCSFYQQPRGCAKAERCDFVHQGPQAGAPPPVAPPAQAAYPGYAQPQPPAAHNAYQATPAAYPAPTHAYAAPAAYPAAGENAPLLPTPPAAGGYEQPQHYDPAAYAAHYAAYYGTAPPAAAPPPAATPAPGSSQRICAYYTTSKGCRKGDRCDFVHPAGALKSQAPSARYSPY